MPNKLQILGQNDNFSFQNEKVWKLFLKDDLTVNGDADGSQVSGQWVAFYDQAMKIDLEDGSSLITNYRYSLKEYVNSDPLKSGAKALAGVETDDYDKFYSMCDRTMVGFVMSKGNSMSNHRIQCVYGIKETAEKPKEEEKKPAPEAPKNKTASPNTNSTKAAATPKPSEKLKVGK